MHWISEFWNFWSALYNMLQTEDTELQLVLSYRFSFSLLVGQLGLKCSFSNMHIHNHMWFLMVHHAFVKLGEKCIIYVSVLDMSWYCFSRYSYQFLVGIKTDWHAYTKLIWKSVNLLHRPAPGINSSVNTGTSFIQVLIAGTYTCFILTKN
jgi:hypothetical protein